MKKYFFSVAFTLSGLALFIAIFYYKFDSSQALFGSGPYGFNPHDLAIFDLSYLFLVSS